MLHCNEDFTLKNKNYKVEISFTNLYRLRGEDSTLYDEVFDPDNIEACVPPPVCDVLSITITSQQQTRRIALVAGVYKLFGHIAVLQNNVLTILTENTAVQFDLQTGQILHSRYLNAYDCFNIYSTKYGLIIHSENDILMLDHELNELWRFHNGNTFLNSEHNDEFTIEKGHKNVRFYDMSGNFYRLVLFTGQLIDYSHPDPDSR